MTLRDALRVLRLREIEQVDAEGRVLPHAAREDATRRALAAAGLPEDPASARRVPARRLARAAAIRARLLESGLSGASRGRLDPDRLGRVLGALAAGSWICALLLGLGTESALGGRRLDLLSLPLLGVLAWNALLLGASALHLAIRAIRRRRDPAWRKPRGGALSGVAMRLAAWAGSRFVRSGGGTASAGLESFWSAFVNETLPFWIHRTKVVLHVGAACFAFGVVAGLYLRGLVRDFRVTWESTWLSPSQVQAWLEALLAPAAWLTGLDVPDAGAVQGPGREGPAAVWIHLFAVTLFLFVVAPRLALAAFEEFRARRALVRVVRETAASWIPQPGSHEAVRGIVVGLGRGLDEQTREAVLLALRETSAAGSRWRIGRSVAYEALHEAAGTVRERGAGALDAEAAPDEAVAAVVSAGQAPEPSLHLAVLEALAARGVPARVLVVDPAGRSTGGAWAAAAERLGVPWRVVSLRRPDPAGAAQEDSKR